jgi:hypothetical protein
MSKCDKVYRMTFTYLVRIKNPSGTFRECRSGCGVYVRLSRCLGAGNTPAWIVLSRDDPKSQQDFFLDQNADATTGLISRFSARDPSP